MSSVGVEVLVLQIDSDLARKSEAALMEAVFGPLVDGLRARGASDNKYRTEYVIQEEIDQDQGEGDTP